MHWRSNHHPQLTPTHKPIHIIARTPTSMGMTIRCFGCTQSCKMLTFPCRYKIVHITVDHFTNAMIHINPQWLPNMQSLSLPQAPPTFLSNPCNASPMIQANLPSSLDAILLLATTTFDSYFRIVVFHHTIDLLYITSLSNCSIPKGLHTQRCNKCWK